MTHLEQLIKKESADNLIEVHNFLTAVFMISKSEEEKEVSIFALMLMLLTRLIELKGNNRKVAFYLEKMDEILIRK